MKKVKKRVLILVIVCLIILVGAFIADKFLSKEYLVEIKYNEVMKKINNGDTFVLLLSQTTCSHCAEYKPKISRVAKKYKVTVYYLETNLLKKKEEKEIKKHFNYSGTPTTVFVIDGYEKTAANRINGDASEDKIISKLKSNGYIK